MSTRNARKKPGGGRGVKASVASQSIRSADECHNMSSPCCALLEQIAMEIFPEAEQFSSKDGNKKPAAAPKSAKEPHLFGQLVRNYLLEQRRNEQGQEQLNANDAGNTKRKRRRKKKKGKETSPDAGSTKNDTTETKSAPTTEETSPEPKQEKTMDPPDQDLATPLEHEAVMPLQRKPLPDHVDRMIDRILKEGNSKQTGVTVANRDLVSFVSFLSQRFDQRQQEEQTKGKKKGKSEDEFSAANLPSIKVKDVEALVESIVCRICRSSVDSYLTSTFIFEGKHRDSESIVIRLSSVTDETNQTPLSLPVTGVNEIGDDDSDVDKAFHYVAMEEGVCLSENEDGTSKGDSDLSIALYAGSDEKGKEKQLQMRALLGENNSISFPLSLKDVHEMVRGILLPCGLSDSLDEEQEEDYKLPQQDFQEIEKMVSENEVYFSDAIHEIGQEIQKLQTRVGETETTTPQTFDVSTSSTLIECDSAADVLLDQMTNVLMRITAAYHSLTALQGAVDWVKNGIDLLWRHYGIAVKTALKGVLLHEGQVMQLASRPGSVPQMFLNAKHRSSHRNMLIEKLKALCNLKSVFGQVLLDHDTNGYKRKFRPPSLVRKLYTYHSFYNMVGKRSGDDEYKKLDDCCNRLLQEYDELIHTIRCASVSDLVTKQELRYERLRTRIMELHAEINASYSMRSTDNKRASSEMISGLREEFDKLMGQTDLKENGIDESSVDYQDSSTVRERQNLESAARNIIKQWRLVRSMLSCAMALADEGSLPSRLPVKLRKWMETGEAESLSFNMCYGGGGQRRVSCIMTGLLYRWLCDRCMEWHAELTQRELVLDEADSIVSGATASRPAKAGKKKKKREKKAAVPAVTDAAQREEVGSETLPASTPLEGVADNEKDSNDSGDETMDSPIVANGTKSLTEPLQNKNKEMPLSSKTGSDKKNNDSGKVNSKTKGAFKKDARTSDESTSIAANRIAKTEQAKPGANEIEQTTPGARETMREEKPSVETSPRDIPTSMGVVGRSGFQSAESFLVSRLDDIFEESKKSASSKKVDIVFLYS